MKGYFLLALLASSMAFANGQDKIEEKFVFDGSQLQGDFQLRHDVQVPVYEYKEVDSTCSREVFDGYDQVCRTRYRQECSNEYSCLMTASHLRGCRQELRCPSRPGTQCRYEEVCDGNSGGNGGGGSGGGTDNCGWHNVCRSVPYEDCDSVPRYHTEYYACKKTVPIQVGTERKVLVNLDATVTFNQPPSGALLNEELVVRISNEDAALSSIKSSGNVLLFDRLQKTVEEGTKLKNIRAEWTIDVVDIASLVSPIKAGIKNLRMEDEAIKFSIGKVARPEFLIAQLELKRKKALGSDPVLFDDAIQGTQLNLKDLGDVTEVEIPLSNLAKGEELKKGTYKLALTVKVGSLAKEPLNKATIPQLNSSSAIEFKLKK